jgi:hypothetical protein
MGRPPIGDRAMTAKERKLRYRLRHRNETHRSILVGLGLATHDAAELDGAIKVELDFLKRHREEYLWRCAVVLGKPIAVEDEIFVAAYQASTSGRKKFRNR